MGFLRRAVADFGQTIVMVTHDPVAASHADGVLFLADGRLAGELEKPTVSAVLDRLGGLEEGR
jgi:putative ABC transport system ATP-binding protein